MYKVKANLILESISCSFETETKTVDVLKSLQSKLYETSLGNKQGVNVLRTPFFLGVSKAGRLM